MNVASDVFIGLGILWLGAMFAAFGRRRPALAEELMSEPADQSGGLRIAQAIPHAVFTTDSHGRCVDSNRAWSAYTGLSAAQTRGIEWLAVAHPLDAQRVAAAWGQARATGTPFEAQLRVRSATDDAAYRWFLARVVPVADAAGVLTKWIGSIVDIHDYKIAADTCGILGTLGHIISISKEDGNFDYVSPTQTSSTGMGVTTGASPDWRDSLHPDDLAIADRGDQPVRLRAVDGSYRWFLSRTAVLTDSGEQANRRVNSLTDIDDLTSTLTALGANQARYEALTDAIPQIIWIVNQSFNVDYVNKRWRTYTGLTGEVGTMGELGLVVHPDDLNVLAACQDRIGGSRTEHECELRMLRHDGTYRWHLLRFVPLSEATPSPPTWIVAATDIESRRSTEAALADSAAVLAHRADHDTLTNLPNRSTLMARLGAMLDDARRDGTLVVVLYLDIDHFKAVNDSLGHNAGDALLIETGNRIRASLRADDTASRFGGDEFVVACRADDIVDVTRIAERLQAAVRTPIELDGKRFSVASSIGISVYPDDGDACADLVQKADAAMYAAKQSGRNAWNFYSAQDHLPALAALELEVELREAIAREQFVVYYQPIINVGSGRVIGAEALVRWAHPERGLLPPSEFIAFAEDHGLIAPIGELVLHAACAQLRRMHLRPSDDFSIAVNVSARQFVKPEFVGTIAAAISVHGIDARRLEIEITESVVMGDSAAVLRTLDRLEALGVRLSLDDFGTGYSSLAYIKSFPIHTLKIDRSFVSDIALNFTDQAIAKTIVTLAHSLGMRTVAEGVETEQQLDLLRSFGADCFQGFLVSRPLASDQFEEFVAGRRSVRVPSA